MGASLAELDRRDRARLRPELVEVVASRFAYPPVFDLGSETILVRPVSPQRRQEIVTFVQSRSLEPIEHVEVSAPEVRRFFEALFLAYLQSNPDMARLAGRRRMPLARAEVARAADEVQRGLVSLAGGVPGTFGNPRPAVSWGAAASRLTRAAPKWERVERDTQTLQSALSRPQSDPGKASSPQTGRSGGEAPRPGGARPAAPSPWADVPMDGTSPLQTVRGGAGPSPFAGLATGSQSAIFGERTSAILPDLATSMQPAVGVGPSRSEAPPKDLPPDLLQLYNEYLRDAQPHASATPDRAPPTVPTAPTGRAPGRGIFGWRGPGAVSREMPTAETAAMAASPGPSEHKTDTLVFQQLRHQLDGYIRLAARNYKVRVHGSDPASALDALRRSGHVDENDLRMAESILALADRVTERGTATLDDYRQALMLYLLYHRSRMGG